MVRFEVKRQKELNSGIVSLGSGSTINGVLSGDWILGGTLIFSGTHNITTNVTVEVSGNLTSGRFDLQSGSTLNVVAGNPTFVGGVTYSSGVTFNGGVVWASGQPQISGLYVTHSGGLYQASGIYLGQSGGQYQVSGIYATGTDKQVSGLYVTHSGGFYQRSGIFQVSGDYPLASTKQASGIYQISGDYPLAHTKQASGIYQTSGVFQTSGLYVTHSGGFYQRSGIFQVSGDYPLAHTKQASGIYQLSGDYVISGTHQASGLYVTHSGGLYQTSGLYVTHSGGLYQVSGIYPTSGLFALSGTGGAGGGGGGSGVVHTALFTGSGDDITTLYTISHGLGVVPTGISMEAASPQARGNVDVSGNASGIFVTYTSPPTSGDVKLTWFAGPSSTAVLASGAWQTSGAFISSGTALPNAIYTITRLPNSTAAVAINNVNQTIDYSGDATVNCSNVFQGVIDNIKNISGVDSSGKFGALVDIRVGRYRWTSGIKMDTSGTVATRNGVILEGNGPGTIIDIQPAARLGDGIYIRAGRAEIKNLLMTGGSGVTNFIRSEGVGGAIIPSTTELGMGTIDHVVIMGPNDGGTFETVSGQTGILLDGISGYQFYWNIHACRFASLDNGIKTVGALQTSTYTEMNTFTYCDTAINIEGGGQHNIMGVWAQGNTFAGHTAIRLGVHTGQNIISHVISELGTDTGECEAIRIESGQTANVIKGVINSFATAPSTGTKCVVRDNSLNGSNSYEYTFGTGASGRHRYHNTELVSPIVHLEEDGEYLINSPFGVAGIELQPELSGGVPFFDWHNQSGDGDYRTRFTREGATNGPFHFIQTGTGGFQFTGNVALTSGFNHTGGFTSGASAGGRGAVPATTAGFMTVQVSGNTVKIPYYLP